MSSFDEMKRTDYTQANGMTQTKMKSGDLVKIDFRLPFQNEKSLGIGIIIEIEEGSGMAYIISSLGTRWEFMTNLILIE